MDQLTTLFIDDDFIENLIDDKNNEIIYTDDFYKDIIDLQGIAYFITFTAGTILNDTVPYKNLGIPIVKQV